ncbi:MAG: TVP38/TMEM64 family protein, partial [Pseudorhodobacter sp.]|nr:TVP38/TMEM64 family protein [Pseudorhodobacter sp.]
MPAPIEDAVTRPANPWLKRLPFMIILAVAVLGAFLLRDQISFEALARQRDVLLAYRDSNFLLASLAFVVGYVVIVAFSLPGATIATLTGGFLFGLFPGVLYNVSAATMGAVGVFLAARAGFGADVAARIEEKGRAAARLQRG